MNKNISLTNITLLDFSGTDPSEFFPTGSQCIPCKPHARNAKVCRAADQTRRCHLTSCDPRRKQSLSHASCRDADRVCPDRSSSGMFRRMACDHDVGGKLALLFPAVSARRSLETSRLRLRLQGQDVGDGPGRHARKVKRVGMCRGKRVKVKRVRVSFFHPREPPEGCQAELGEACP